MLKKLFKTIQLSLCLYFIIVLFTNKTIAQVNFVESSIVTDEALFFWKEDDPKPYHYGAAINPHGNCIQVVNGYVFYTWYKGGFSDRSLMVSRKKIGEGEWINVTLPGKLSLVGNKGDTHLTTNIGVCPIDGTIHIMYDHHNEDLNYIVSKKNIAFANDSEFNADNFLPQQDYLVEGKKVIGVTYPKMINNNQGELFFERRHGSAVGGDVMISYYNGDKWSNEIRILQGKGAEVTQGERNFCYGKPYLFNGEFYYVYSVRWAESPTRLDEGVYIVNLGTRMDKTATTLDGKVYNLPITDHTPFLIADPRSVPTTEGWAGGPDAAISEKNDIYLKISPKNTPQYNYLKKAGDTEFTEERNKGGLGIFYGNRMYKCTSSNGVLTVQSCEAQTYNWQTDYTLETGINVQKSQVLFDNGKIVAIYAEKKQSDKVPIHCFVFDITKPEYTPQNISFEPLAEVIESDSTFEIYATASSELPIKFTSSNNNIATIIEGNKVKIMGVGSCEIIASQAGNGKFDNAPNVSHSLIVNADTNKTNQTITFSLPNNTHEWGNADEILSAIATSGLPIQYASTDTTVAVIKDEALHVKRAGKTIIKAMQTGNATYNAAPIVNQELIVPKQTQVITFETIPQKTSGDPEFKLVAKSNNPNANIRFVCPNNQVAVVWSDIVRQVLGTGDAVITASATEDDYFTAASTQQTFVVNSKTFTIPAKIEAEYYTSKSGVNVTRWSNTVFYLNSWEANDYAEYTIDVPKDTTYALAIRAASPGGTKRIKIVANGETLGTTDLIKTASLTKFGTKTVTVPLKAGVQKIRIIGVVGGFNLDWISIKDGSGSSIDPDNDDDNDDNKKVPDYVSPQNYYIHSVDGEQAPNLAVNLFDGNITDDARWSVNEFPKSVIIDLGEEREIIGTRLWTYQNRAYKYKIEFSNSGNDGFALVVDRTNNTSSEMPISNDFEIQEARYVKLTITGCHNYSSSWVSINELAFIFNGSTSTKNFEKPNISAYVNNNHLYIKSSYKRSNQVSIYSIGGKLIFNQQFNSSNISIPVQYHPGIYLVKVSNNNLSRIFRIAVN